MSAALLEVDNVTVAYSGREPVLFDINLTVQQGESVGVIGMNGAGKSTLLKSISGLMRAPSGNVQPLGCTSIRNPQVARQRRQSWR